jgi:uncharacterized protein YyaL (SSP411 family)
VAEVAITGDPSDPATSGLLEVALGGYTPARVVALAPTGAGPSEIPLLRDRPQLKSRPTAYVCVGFACRRPVTDPDALRDQLTEVEASV